MRPTVSCSQFLAGILVFHFVNFLKFVIFFNSCIGIVGLRSANPTYGAQSRRHMAVPLEARVGPW